MSDQTPPTTYPQQRQEKHVTSIDPDANAEEDSFRLETPSSTKQKRKRTNPRDHAILESAYQKNSKPDKDERLELVELVDLGEKEVQIWFQNRRQNDRRKSKPLQPHELIPHFRNGIPVEAKQLPSPQNSQELAEELAESDPDQSKSRPAHDSSPQSHDQRSDHDKSDIPATSSPAAILQQTPLTAAVSSTPPSSLTSSAQRLNAAISDSSPSVAVAMSHAQVVKKRSHEQMTGADQGAQADEDSPKNTKSLRRTSSFVRLGFSADGSVKVRVNNETTPSPPKERPTPPSNMVNRKSSPLTRAQSDVSSTFRFRDVATAPRGTVGRSRDARTWEFYCDRSNRSSLAVAAEKEATGSAVGALGLMRSASQRRTQALSPNPGKQTHLRRTQSGLRAKPNLARTRSSMARLQSSDGTYDEESIKAQKLGHERRGSGNDSDKENWLPGTHGSAHGVQRTGAPSRRSSIIQQHGHPSSPLPSTADKENRPRLGGRKEKGDDLDCVQGLLSLSQGAWR